MAIPPSGMTDGQARAKHCQQEYRDYLALTEEVQADLKDDVDELRSQEGWDHDTSRGVDEWVNDTDSIWRVLRVSRELQPSSL
jgi:hypothetical protein